MDHRSIGSRIAVAHQAEDACSIAQAWTVRSLKGRRAGTTGLANCTGLAVRSPLDGIGCLAHIEAQERPMYEATFKCFLVYMIGKIRKYGPRGGHCGRALRAGLFGNSGGARDRAFTAAIHAHPIAAGIAHNDILDQRNRLGDGRHYTAGPPPRNDTAITDQPAPGDGIVRCFQHGGGRTRNMPPVHRPSTGMTNSGPFFAPPVHRCVTALYFV